MGTAAFQPHQMLTMRGTRYVIQCKVDDATWQLKEANSPRVIEHSDDALRKAYTDRELVFHNNQQPITELRMVHREVSAEKMEQAKIRRLYVEGIIGYPSAAPLVEPIIQKVWEKIRCPAQKPGARSVLRWRSAYLKQDRDVLALVANDQKKGCRTQRIDGVVEELVKQAVDRIYLTLEQRRMSDVLDHAQALVLQENDKRPSSMQLKLPTIRLVRRLIEAIPRLERDVCRYGSTTAMKMHRAAMGRRITEFPLERVEIDHTQIDLFVVDEKNALPMGRPWLTLCIDVNTRCILGIHLSFDPPSYLTVAKCLRHAFLPKTGLKEIYPDIQNEWEAHGVMRQLVLDNGMEFHSEALENACLTLGIEMHYAPRKTPWFKGSVERMFGTLQNDLIHAMPGTTFSNTFLKGDYNPEKHAVICLGTLHYLLNKWIVDYYHQKPHRELQARPIDAWRSRISREEIMVPDDPGLLDAILGKSFERRLRHDGIQHNNLHYNDPAMRRLRERHGNELKLEIRVDESDLGKIIVFSPDKKQRFVVNAVDFSYANGLTLWQHQVIQNYAREYLKSLDPRNWIMAKEAIRKIIQSEVNLKNPKKASIKAARFMGEAEVADPRPIKGHKEVPKTRQARASTRNELPKKTSHTNHFSESNTSIAFQPQFVDRSTQTTI